MLKDERLIHLVKIGRITEREAMEAEQGTDKKTERAPIIDRAPKSFVGCLLLVVDYLNGKTDIYAPGYGRVVNVWNDAWDEMRYMGYNPESATSIKRYIAEQIA